MIRRWQDLHREPLEQGTQLLNEAPAALLALRGGMAPPGPKAYWFWGWG